MAGRRSVAPPATAALGLLSILLMAVAADGHYGNNGGSGNGGGGVWVWQRNTNRPPPPPPNCWGRGYGCVVATTTRRPRPTTTRRPTPTAAPCFDNNVNCGTWAQTGHCEGNWGYMRTFCCASCSVNRINGNRIYRRRA